MEKKNRKDIPTFSKEEIHEAEKQSQSIPSFSAEEIAQAEEEVAFNLDPEQIETGVRGVLEGASFGASEPVASAFNAATGYFVDPDSSFSERYDQDVDRRRALKDKYPKTQLVSDVTGAIASPATGIAAKALLKAPGAVLKAGKALKNMISPELPLMPVVKALEELPIASRTEKLAEILSSIKNSGKDIAGKAVSGGSVALGSEALRRGIEGSSGHIKEEDNLHPLSDVTKTGVQVGAALASIGPVAKGAAALGKGILSAVGGVRVGDIEAYLVSPKRISQSKDIAVIKHEVDRIVGKLKSDVESKQLDVDQAKEILKLSEFDLRNKISDIKTDIRISKADIKQNYREASRNLENSFKDVIQDLKSMPSPATLTEEVLEGVDAIKDKTSLASKKSYEILERERNQKFNLAGMAFYTQALEDSLKVEGRILSDSKRQAVSVLGKWKHEFKQLPNVVRLPKVKTIIQNLDDDIRDASGSGDRGSYNPDAYNVLMDLRVMVDDTLKHISTDYREQMEEVYRLNKLRMEASRIFGKPGPARSKLSKIDSPALEDERNLLVKIGDETGKDFKTPLDDYLKTQGLLKSIPAKERLKRQLSEYPAYEEAAKQSARATRPEFELGPTNQAKFNSPEAEAVRDAQLRLGQSKMNLSQSQEAFEPFKNITPMTSQEKIQALLGDPKKKIELRSVFKELSKLSDSKFGDLVQQIDDYKVKSAFEKTNEMGGKHVYFWTFLLGAIGSKVSSDHQAISSGGGAILGMLSSRFGPIATKGILDIYSSINGIPTVRKIAQLSNKTTPEAAKWLQQNLVQTVTVGTNQQGPVAIPKEDYQQTLIDIDGAKNLNSIEKAKAIDSLNRFGNINSEYLERVMIDSGENFNHSPQITFEEGPIESKSDAKLEDILKSIRSYKQ